MVHDCMDGESPVPLRARQLHDYSRLFRHGLPKASDPAFITTRAFPANARAKSYDEAREPMYECLPLKEPECFPRNAATIYESCEACCDPKQGSGGNPNCWSGPFTYELCCRAPSSPSLEQTSTPPPDPQPEDAAVEPSASTETPPPQQAQAEVSEEASSTSPPPQQHDAQDAQPEVVEETTTTMPPPPQQQQQPQEAEAEAVDATTSTTMAPAQPQQTEESQSEAIDAAPSTSLAEPQPQETLPETSGEPSASSLQQPQEAQLKDDQLAAATVRQRQREADAIAWLSKETARCADQDTENHELQKELESIVSVNKDNGKVLGVAKEELRIWSELRDGKKARVQEVEDLIVSTRAQTVELNESILVAKQQQKDLRGKRAACATERSYLGKRLNDTRDEIANHAADKAAHADNMAKDKEQILQGIERRLEGQSRELNKSDEEVEVLTKNVSDLQTQLEAVNAEKERLQAALEEVNLEYESLAKKKPKRLQGDEENASGFECCFPDDLAENWTAMSEYASCWKRVVTESMAAAWSR